MDNKAQATSHTKTSPWRNPVSKALVLIHPEPQSEAERDFVSVGKETLDSTINGPLFTKIGRYLEQYRDRYDYIVYLPVELFRDDAAAWASPWIHPSISRYKDEIDVINEHDLEDQALILKRILMLKKINVVHLAGLSRAECVKDIAYWLIGRSDEVGFIPESHTLSLRQLHEVARASFKVKILPALTG